jgi:hypothetical protein
MKDSDICPNMKFTPHERGTHYKKKLIMLIILTLLLELGFITVQEMLFGDTPDPTEVVAEAPTEEPTEPPATEPPLGDIEDGLDWG